MPDVKPAKVRVFVPSVVTVVAFSKAPPNPIELSVLDKPFHAKTEPATIEEILAS